MPPEEESPQAEGLLSSLMDKITGTGKDSSSFPVTLVLVGFMVLVLSVFGIRMAFAKRKAAQLAAKIRKIEEEREQVKEKVKLAENSTARQTAKEEVTALSKEILSLNARMVQRHVEHQKDVEELRSVTSWDDIIRANDGAFLGLASEY